MDEYEFLELEINESDLLLYTSKDTSSNLSTGNSSNGNLPKDISSNNTLSKDISSNDNLSKGNSSNDAISANRCDETFLNLTPNGNWSTEKVLIQMLASYQPLSQDQPVKGEQDAVSRFQSLLALFEHGTIELSQPTVKPIDSEIFQKTIDHLKRLNLMIYHERWRHASPDDCSELKMHHLDDVHDRLCNLAVHPIFLSTNVKAIDKLYVKCREILETIQAMRNSILSPTNCKHPRLSRPKDETLFQNPDLKTYLANGNVIASDLSFSSTEDKMANDNSTNVSSTNFSSTNASSTNVSSTNASSTNASSTNASSTNVKSRDNNSTNDNSANLKPTLDNSTKVNLEPGKLACKKFTVARSRSEVLNNEPTATGDANFNSTIATSCAKITNCDQGQKINFSKEENLLLTLENEISGFQTPEERTAELSSRFNSLFGSLEYNTGQLATNSAKSDSNENFQETFNRLKCLNVMIFHERWRQTSPRDILALEKHHFTVVHRALHGLALRQIFLINLKRIKKLNQKCQTTIKLIQRLRNVIESKPEPKHPKLSRPRTETLFLNPDLGYMLDVLKSSSLKYEKSPTSERETVQQPLPDDDDSMTNEKIDFESKFETLLLKLQVGTLWEKDPKGNENLISELKWANAEVYLARSLWQSLTPADGIALKDHHLRYIYKMIDSLGKEILTVEKSKNKLKSISDIFATLKMAIRLKPKAREPNPVTAKSSLSTNPTIPKMPSEPLPIVVPPDASPEEKELLSKFEQIITSMENKTRKINRQEILSQVHTDWIMNQIQELLFCNIMLFRTTFCLARQLEDKLKLEDHFLDANEHVLSFALRQLHLCKKPNEVMNICAKPDEVINIKAKPDDVINIKAKPDDVLTICTKPDDGTDLKFVRTLESLYNLRLVLNNPPNFVRTKTATNNFSRVVHNILEKEKHYLTAAGMESYSKTFFKLWYDWLDEDKLARKQRQAEKVSDTPFNTTANSSIASAKPFNTTDNSSIASAKPFNTTDNSSIASAKPFNTTANSSIASAKPFNTTDNSSIASGKPFTTDNSSIASAKSFNIINNNIPAENPSKRVLDVPHLHLPIKKSKSDDESTDPLFPTQTVVGTSLAMKEEVNINIDHSDEGNYEDEMNHRINKRIKTDPEDHAIANTSQRNWPNASAQSQSMNDNQNLSFKEIQIKQERVLEVEQQQHTLEMGSNLRPRSFLDAMNYSIDWTKPDQNLSKYCFYCQSIEHELFYCGFFKGLSMSERWRAITNLSTASSNLSTASYTNLSTANYTSLSTASYTNLSTASYNLSTASYTNLSTNSSNLPCGSSTLSTSIICTLCLRSGHHSGDCRSDVSCLCGERSHVLLHNCSANLLQERHSEFDDQYSPLKIDGGDTAPKTMSSLSTFESSGYPNTSRTNPVASQMSQTIDFNAPVNPISTYGFHSYPVASAIDPTSDFNAYHNPMASAVNPISTSGFHTYRVASAINPTSALKVHPNRVTSGLDPTRDFQDHSCQFLSGKNPFSSFGFKPNPVVSAINPVSAFKACHNPVTLGLNPVSALDPNQARSWNSSNPYSHLETLDQLNRFSMDEDWEKERLLELKTTSLKQIFEYNAPTKENARSQIPPVAPVIPEGWNPLEQVPCQRPGVGSSGGLFEHLTERLGAKGYNPRIAKHMMDFWEQSGHSESSLKKLVLQNRPTTQTALRILLVSEIVSAPNWVQPNGFSTDHLLHETIEYLMPSNIEESRLASLTPLKQFVSNKIKSMLNINDEHYIHQVSKRLTEIVAESGFDIQSLQRFADAKDNKAYLKSILSERLKSPEVKLPWGVTLEFIVSNVTDFVYSTFGTR